MRRSLAVGILISFCLQVHFMMVLYRHYKNAKLFKHLGGCQPDDDHEISLGHVQPDYFEATSMEMTATVPRHDVEHAVDDSNLEQAIRSMQMTV